MGYEVWGMRLRKKTILRKSRRERIVGVLREFCRLMSLCANIDCYIGEIEHLLTIKKTTHERIHFNFQARKCERQSFPGANAAMDETTDGLGRQYCR